jgi:glycosyltransferase involved in cell wall biosynthesis
MDKRKVAILIPSYKRPEVLDLTLSGVVDTTDDNLYDIHIGVALNQVRPQDVSVTDKYKEIFLNKGIPFRVLTERINIGKAEALNKLFDEVIKKGAFGEGDYIVTMDNDMHLRMPWMHLIKDVEDLDFELLGFGSIKFWCHLPERSKCNGKPYKERYILYALTSIAGGMMLFPWGFLNKHRWTNHGGVYGEDDATMCTIAKKKYVLAWDEDWLRHDPLMNSTDELRQYQSKKEALYAKQKYVFEPGWDEK